MKIKKFTLALIISSGLLSCATTATQNAQVAASSQNADELMIVDCLLPSQVRKLGTMATYLTARRAIKTAAVDCEIRGGEYIAYDRANYMTALNIWLPKAQSGDPEAQNYVGEIYEKGLGISPDYEMARVWYKKSAQQGYNKAQMNLGFLYEKGLGGDKDTTKAMEWYRKSSNLPDLDIPFASTISSDSNNEQLSTELKVLQTALKNSQAEAKQLRSKLAGAEKRLLDGKTKLSSLENEAASVKQKIQTEAETTNQHQNGELEQQLLAKEKLIGVQQKKVAALEQSYQKEISDLKISLQDTQKRADRIAEELKKKNDNGQQAQVALLQTEAKLAATQQKLLDVDHLSQQRLDELNELKNKLNAQQVSRENQQLVLAERKILAYEQEKIATQQTIARLEQENERIKLAEQEINLQLKESGLTDKKMDQLQQKLAQQKRLAIDTQQSLTEIKNKLSSSEQEKKQLIHLVDSGREEKERYLNDISKKTEEIENLRKQLNAEKQRFETEIQNLQNVAHVAQVTDKPKIEIIDPPFVLTRGMPTVTLRSLVSSREIIGKVEAPEGLLSLSINDQKSAVDRSGLFKRDIRLLGDETPVQVVAVNKKGGTASLNFILTLDKAIKRSQESVDTIVARKQYNWKDLKFGQYHALVIGNNNYHKVPKLDTPEQDAQEIEKILRTKYGFKTHLLLNGTRYQILSELNKLRASLTEEDNLLIYYAGHGELDQVNMRGHWLPVDAEGDNTANWISTVSITDILNAMAVKHIMVVSDSCYSGAMTRSSLARLDSGVTTKQRNDWLKAMLKARSRTVLTSGGLKPVMDGGGGKHSVFANAFIKTLQTNESLLEGQELYRNVSSNIVAIAADYGVEQVPEYAPIRHAGHESGEFFFVPNNKKL